MRTAADYDTMVADLVASGTISDAGMVYFDIRPSAHLPTVELRICDACPLVDDVVLIAGLFRALVQRARGWVAQGRPFPQIRHELLRAATWRAARSGLEGDLVDLAHPSGPTLVPPSRLIERLVSDLQPELDAFGDWKQVRELSQRALATGSSAACQRRMFDRRGELIDVVDGLLAHTRGSSQARDPPTASAPSMVTRWVAIPVSSTVDRMNSGQDVVVIGGGIAGVSIAYELAAHRRVTVLETETSLATHATGRSAAMYVPGHGGPLVRALITASGPRFASLAAELDAPGLLRSRPMLWAAFDDDGEQVLRAELAQRVGEPNAPVELSPPEALARCPALRLDVLRTAAIIEAAGELDVMALHQAYVRGLRRRGGRVRVAAPVTGLAAVAGGWQVRCGMGEVLHAADVVNAAGAWADIVASLAGVPRLGLRPLRRTIAVARVSDPTRLRPPDGAPLPMVVEAREGCYFRAAQGANLLLSPSDETPVEPGDVRPDPRDVALALERVEALTGLGLRSVHRSWAGLRSFVADRAPVVGSWPHHPGFHFFAGQGGFGIETAPALAALGAAIVLGGSPPPDIPFDPAALAPTRFT
jgi:D-arginine dehydrogenase